MSLRQVAAAVCGMLIATEVHPIAGLAVERCNTRAPTLDELGLTRDQSSSAEVS